MSTGTSRIPSVERFVRVCALGLWAASSPQVVRAQVVVPFEVLHSFARQPGYPLGRLLEANDGALYGTTLQGGAFAAGTVFVLRPGSDGSWTHLTLHAFNGSDGRYPAGGLILALDGSLYGTTSDGPGTIFRISPEGAFTTVFEFAYPYSYGTSPFAGLIQASDGNLYGTTLGSPGGVLGGTVFRMTPEGAMTTLHVFSGADGRYPYGSLVQASDGALYGTTWEGGDGNYGTIFRIGPGGAFTSLHSFDLWSDGAHPFAALVEGADGQLYGTASAVNLDGGTAFRISPGGVFTLVHVFDAGDEGGGPFGGLIQARDGNLYGTLAGGNYRGTVFKMTLAGEITPLYFFDFDTGDAPYAGLIQGRDGSFYGVTYSAGPKGAGTVFAIDPVGNHSTLVAFDASEGLGPVAGLADGGDGTLWGTTYYGGAGLGAGVTGQGTIYKMDGARNVVTVRSFNTDDGVNPTAPLVKGDDGNFYGMTRQTIFRVTPAGDFGVLYDLSGAGGDLRAGLLRARDGDLYGTDLLGPEGKGSVFKITTAGAFTRLHVFASGAGEGRNPLGGLIQARDGEFYGTTAFGGASGFGTVFRMTSSGAVTTLHSFSFLDGAIPTGALVEGPDGSFYGTTFRGGLQPRPLDLGTVFRMSPAGVVTTLHSFNYGDGTNPIGGLMLASDGNLYGTAAYPGADGGSVFRVSVAGEFTLLHAFGGSGGGNPQAVLLEGSDGWLYGTTVRGGTGEGGVVFRIRIR